MEMTKLDKQGHKSHPLLFHLSRLSGAGTPSGGSGGGGFGGYKSGGVTTPGSVPSLRLTGVSDGPPPSVDSPASITPSPLPTPHSQPSSVPHHGMDTSAAPFILYTNKTVISE